MKLIPAFHGTIYFYQNHMGMIVTLTFPLLAGETNYAYLGKQDMQITFDATSDYDRGIQDCINGKPASNSLNSEYISGYAFQYEKEASITAGASN